MIKLCLMSFIISFQLFAICIDSKFNYDLDCNCATKKNCYKPYNDKYVKTRNKSLTQNFDKKLAKKIARVGASELKGMDNIFNGAFEYKSQDLTKIKEANSKLVGVQKKLQKRVELQLKKLGFKQFKLVDRKKRLKAYLEKSLPEKYKKNFQMRSLKFANMSSKENFNKNNATKDSFDMESGSEDLSIQDVERRLREQTMKKANQFKRNKKFKIAGFYNKDKNLFTAISKRYELKFIKSKNVSEMIAQSGRDNIKKSLRSIIDKLKRIR